MSTIKVKALEWEPGVVDWARPMPGMKYVACSTTPQGSWGWWLDGAPETRSVHPSEDDAKAAAQADYERRILSALEPPPDMREAVEALEEYAREASKAITGLVGGGSELFGKQIGGLYTADLEYCVARIRNRFADGHEAKVALAKAETNLRHWREECGKLHAQVRSLTGAKQ